MAGAVRRGVGWNRNEIALLVGFAAETAGAGTYTGTVAIPIQSGQTEKIKKFRLICHEWSVESGELSPTLKLRRDFIHEKYYQVIEDTYRSAEFNYRSES